MGNGEEVPGLPGRSELELDGLAALDCRRGVAVALGALRKAPQPREPGEERQADVEEAVAARGFELARLEERRRLVLLLSPVRLRGIELREARRLSPELALRLALRVVPEEPEGDHRRDEPGQRDPG